jgi:hypothetical protein
LDDNVKRPADRNRKDCGDEIIIANPVYFYRTVKNDTFAHLKSGYFYD